MNVFHWHMTGWDSPDVNWQMTDLIEDCPVNPNKDHQSFTFETKLSDEVFRYGKNYKYSHEDVKEIIEYARVRGIRARLNDTERQSEFAHLL